MGESRSAACAATNLSRRESVLTRVFDAPREFVFKPWTDFEHLKHRGARKGSRG